MKVLKKKLYRWLLIGVIALVAVRLALPYAVKWYLNNRVLNHMEAYRGHVDDVDLSLWRGAYTIQGLKIVKIGTRLEAPFVDVEEMDLSVQWKALFDGAIVGEVECRHPSVHFAFSDSEEASQTGTEEDWVEVVKSLMPIRINRFAMIDGRVALTNVLAKPSTDLPLEGFNLEIRNIQNVAVGKDDALPSSVTASGFAPDYGGRLSFTADANLLKNIPDFDYNMRFENVELTSLNPLAMYYSGMDFEKGIVSVYSEMAMQNGAFEGYIKPLVKDMRIFGWREKGRPLGQWFREFFSEGIQEIFENQKKQQFATRVPISGELSKVKTDIWLTIVNAFKNAYIRAFEYKLDQSIDFEDLQKHPKGQKKNNGEMPGL